MKHAPTSTGLDVRGLNAEEWSFLDDLLGRVMDLPQSERELLIEKASRDRPELRPFVVDFLSVLPEVDGFLEEPIWDHARILFAHFDRQLIRDLESTGRFKIEKPLGEGGMGRVFLAKQLIPFQRDVAIKALLPHTGQSERFRGSFEAECQALARMAHENVARIFDADITADGVPYLAMEYYPGEAITAFATAAELTIVDRLKLFLQICAGVHHAHQRQILHRDLKPSNVLVGGSMENPMAKIIDFGIAQSLNPDDQETRPVDAMAGTLTYMSPEQLNGDYLDVRTDVYSLGILLHELLVGFPPFDAEQAHGLSFVQFRDLILNKKPEAASLALLRKIKGSRADRSKTLLVNRLKGDLDYIIQKAIAKNRDDRYSDVNALAQDIKAHLSILPINDLTSERPYVIKKFIRRNQAAFSAVTGFVFLLILMVVTLSLSLNETIAARKEAEIAQRETEQKAEDLQETLTFLQSILASPRFESNAHDTKLIEMLNFALEYLAENPQSLEVQSEVYQTLGRSFLSIGDTSAATASFRKAVEIRASLFGPLSETTLSAVERLATCYTQTNQWEEAECLYQSVLAADPSFELTGLARRGLADLMRQRGNYPTALVLYHQALPWAREKSQVQHHLTLKGLGIVHQRMGRLSLAEAFFQEALASFFDALGPDHPYTQAALNNWADTLMDMGFTDEATELFRDGYETRLRVLDRRHPETLDSQHNFARGLYRQGAYSQAMTEAQKVTSLREEVLGPYHLDTLNAMDLLARCFRRLGDHERAIHTLDQALAFGKLHQGPDHPLLLRMTNNLADILIRSSRADQAVSLLQSMMPDARARFGDAAPDTYLFQITLTEAYIAQAAFSDATSVLETSMERASRNLKETDMLQGLFSAYLGLIQLRQGNWVGAEHLIKQGIDVLNRNRSPYLSIAEGFFADLQKAKSAD